MTTPASIERNRFSYVSAGETTPNRPPISYERVQAIVLITAIGVTGAAVGVVKRRRDDEGEGVDADSVRREEAVSKAIRAVENHGMTDAEAGDLVGYSAAWVSDRMLNTGTATTAR